MNLCRKFASGGHDDGHRAFHLFQGPLILDVSEKREQEGDGFPRSSLSYTDNIPPRHDGWNSLRLDRSRGVVIKSFDNVQATMNYSKSGATV